jgi:photoactive yellow protein
VFPTEAFRLAWVPFLDAAGGVKDVLGRGRNDIVTLENMILCAWCAKEIRATATADSHGICLDCLPVTFAIPVESLASLSRERLDALPYGVVILDFEDRVLEFNAFEGELARRSRDDVIGRLFFTEIAPCTNVDALAGWVRRARANGVDAQTQVMFVFRFSFGQRLVDLDLAFVAATNTVTIVVRETGSEDSART